MYFRSEEKFRNKFTIKKHGHNQNVSFVHNFLKSNNDEFRLATGNLVLTTYQNDHI